MKVVINMMLKLGELKVDRFVDYKCEVVKSLESNGYTLIRTSITPTTILFDIAIELKEGVTNDPTNRN